MLVCKNKQTLSFSVIWKSSLAILTMVSFHELSDNQ